jgi:hypothetical protein
VKRHRLRDSRDEITKLASLAKTFKRSQRPNASTSGRISLGNFRIAEYFMQRDAGVPAMGMVTPITEITVKNGGQQLQGV